MAEAVQAGAGSVANTTVHLIGIDGEDIEQGRYRNAEVMATLDASDAIIFGSPTYMGGPAAQFKAFADASVASWTEQRWRNKTAAGFTVSGTPSGDKFSTLQYFHTLAMEHGMIWVGLGEMPLQPNGINRLGSWGGAMAEANQQPVDIAPNAEDLSTGQALGHRVAIIAAKYGR
jgi:NAD(P)H dehydrogenase (quinone)